MNTNLTNFYENDVPNATYLPVNLLLLIES